MDYEVYKKNHRTTIIAAVSGNNCIGRKGRVPWDCPEDLKFFKDTTTNSAVVMGRKTWKSIGSKPLKNRFNIVLSRKHFWKIDDPILSRVVCHDDVEVAYTLEHAFNLCTDRGLKGIFVVGGAEIYKLAMPYADRMIITHIPGDFDGDAFFNWDEDRWVGEELEVFKFGSSSASCKIYEKII